MKLIAFMCVYNEADYLAYSLRSIYDHVDSIIVIEGTWGEAAASSGRLRSDDGTLEILKSFPDPAGKIQVHHLNEKDQLAQRSRVFDFLPEEDCWMLLIDGDEVYPEKSIKKVRRFADEDFDTSNSEELILMTICGFGAVLKFRSLIFVNDFYHVSKVDYPRLFKVNGGRDEESGKAYHAFIEPNAIGRLTESGYLPMITDPSSAIDVFSWPDVEFFHYSYAKSPRRFLEKKRERTKIHGQFAWELRRDPETGEELVQRDDATIEEFHGEHPDVMENHPLRHVRRHKRLPPPAIFCVVSHSGIGNLIQATPCLKALRTTYPDDHIHVLTWRRSSRILEGWGVVDMVVEHHPLQFIRSLRRKPRAILLSPAGAVWDQDWNNSALHVLQAEICDIWEAHESEYLMAFARHLGYQGPTPTPEVHVFEQNWDNARKFVAKNGLQDFVCLNASYIHAEHWPLKHLGSETYVRLAKEINALGLQCVFVGGPDDWKEAGEIIGKVGAGAVNACGLSGDVKDTAALLGLSRLVAGNDGGLMHVAAALGIPTVTGFTFTNPVKNAPRGPGKHVVVARPCPDRIRCQHGGRWAACGPKGCLEVPVDQMVAEVKGILSS